MFAVIKTGGKQYKVSEGDILDIEKLEIEEGGEVVFEGVLLLEDEDTKIGKPEVEGVSVKAKVVKQGREDKKIVYKYKPKKRQRKKQGHRQPFTRVEIKEIKAA